MPHVVGGRQSMKDSSADEAVSSKRWGSQEHPSAVTFCELKGRKAAGASSPIPPVSEQEGPEDRGHALSKAKGHRVSLQCCARHRTGLGVTPGPAQDRAAPRTRGPSRWQGRRRQSLIDRHAPTASRRRAVLQGQRNLGLAFVVQAARQSLLEVLERTPGVCRYATAKFGAGAARAMLHRARKLAQARTHRKCLPPSLSVCPTYQFQLRRPSEREAACAANRSWAASRRGRAETGAQCFGDSAKRRNRGFDPGRSSFATCCCTRASQAALGERTCAQRRTTATASWGSTWTGIVPRRNEQTPSA
jgi:hypothetical protein